MQIIHIHEDMLSHVELLIDKADFRMKKRQTSYLGPHGQTKIINFDCKAERKQ